MIAHESPKEEGTDNEHPLDHETDPQRVPEDWLQAGVDEDVDVGETRYYALQYVHERELTQDPDVLAARTDGPGETNTIHVRYVRGDGHRALERSYAASITETGDGVRVEPKHLSAWPATISVGGREDELASIQRSEVVVGLLAELHGVHPGPRVVDVTELLDTPAGRDEYGPPDEDIEECDSCGVLFRRGGEHRCQSGWVSWSEYQADQDGDA